MVKGPDSRAPARRAIKRLRATQSPTCREFAVMFFLRRAERDAVVKT
jgi:hypothetical protein